MVQQFWPTAWHFIEEDPVICCVGFFTHNGEAEAELLPQTKCPSRLSPVQSNRSTTGLKFQSQQQRL